MSDSRKMQHNAVVLHCDNYFWFMSSKMSTGRFWALGGKTNNDLGERLMQNWTKNTLQVTQLGNENCIGKERKLFEHNSMPEGRGPHRILMISPLVTMVLVGSHMFRALCITLSNGNFLSVLIFHYNHVLWFMCVVSHKKSPIPWVVVIP